MRGRRGDRGAVRRGGGGAQRQPGDPDRRIAPVLGGNASSEIRMWICGARGPDNKETGILEEIMLDNYYRNPTLNYPIWDTVLYEKARFQPSLTMLLNCTCNDVTMDGDRIASIRGWQLNTQTWHIVKARYFADCSGDSVLRISGAEYPLGPREPPRVRRVARARGGRPQDDGQLDPDPTARDRRRRAPALHPAGLGHQVRREQPAQPPPEARRPQLLVAGGGRHGRHHRRHRREPRRAAQDRLRHLGLHQEPPGRPRPALGAGVDRQRCPASARTCATWATTS